MVYTASLLRKWAPDFTDPSVIQGYYLSLKSIEYESLREACKIATETLEEFPTIAKFREMCGYELPKNHKQQGIEAANQVYMSLLNPNQRTPLNELAVKIRNTMTEYDRSMLTADKIERMRHGWSSLGEQIARDMDSKKLEPTAVAIEAKNYTQVPQIEERKPSDEFKANTVSRLLAIRMKIAEEIK